MRRFSVTIVALVALAFGPRVFAGGMEGGGGKGVLCRNGLRTLDIYEAEEVYRLPAVPHFPTLDENVQEYGRFLLVYWSPYSVTPDDANLRDEALRYSHALGALFRDIGTGMTLPLTPDATLPVIPPDCAFVQIAVYDDARNVVHRDPVLWNKLDSYNQTALIWHEIYYHSARSVNATTSDQTMRMIGLGMSNQLPEPRMKPFWGASKWLACRDDGYQFGFRGRDEVQNGVSGVALYAEVFGGVLADFRTTTFLPGVSLADFSSSSPLQKDWQTRVQNEFTGDAWNFELKIENSFSGSAQMRAWKDNQPLPGFSEGNCVLWNVGGGVK